MERPEELTRWLGRIELAKRYQDKHGNTDGRWDRNVKASAGDFNSAQELGDEAIDVNLVRATMKTALPPMWLSEPHISIKPTTPRFKGADNVRMAEVTETELNYWHRELSTRKQVKKAIIDAESTNLGYVVVGYVKDPLDVQDSEGNRTEPDLTIQHRKPFIKRHSPKNVLVPPGYDDLEDCPWVDLVYLKPKRHVVEKYGLDDAEAMALDVRAFKDSVESHGSSSILEEYLGSEDAELVAVHNIWDKESKKVYIVASGIDRFLSEPKPWPYDIEGFPVCVYRPEWISDEYFGTPPTSYYLPQNKELNAIRTAMRVRRNRTKSVIWMDTDIAQDAAERYANAKDGEIIRLPLQDQDIRTKMVVDAGLPFDQGDLMYDSVIKKDILEQSGLSAEQRGAADPNVDTATQSANIEKGGQIRQAERGDGVKDLYIDITRKLWMILKQFPNEKRTRLIAGPEAGAFTEVEYTLRDLRGEFNFDMDFGAMLADNPQARATQAILKYNLMRADPLVNPEMLILDVLKTQNTPDPGAYLLTLKSPDQELAMMLQGLPVQAHERDPHEEHMATHDQQAGMLDQQMQFMDERGGTDSEQRMKLALAQTLLTAHFQDHVRIMQEMTGQQTGPIAENLLRNQIRAGAGSETEAEMSGQPLSGPQLVS